MAPTTHGDIAISVCPNCAGTWIGGVSLNQFFAKYSDVSDIEEAFEEILELEFNLGTGVCPVCLDRCLKEVQVDDTWLDYCISCKGLFFDRGELQALFPKVRRVAAETDAGAPGSIADMMVSFLSWLKGDRR